MATSLPRSALAGVTTSRPSARSRAAQAPWLAAGAALLVVAGAFVWVKVASPSDGARVPPGAVGFESVGLRVAPIGQGTSPLRVGDVVVTVDARPVSAIAQGLFDPRAPRPPRAPGDVVVYGVLRGGEPTTVPVTLRAYPLTAVARANWGTIVFAFVYLLVASFVYLRRPATPAARPFFLSACALVAATTWSFGLGVDDLVGGAGFWLYQTGAALAFTLFWSAGLCFGLRFPTPLALARWRGTTGLVLGAPLLVVVAHAAWQRLRHDEVLTWLATWHRAVDLHAALALAATLVVFLVQWRTQGTPTGTQQVRWVLLAAFTVGCVGLALYLLPPLVGRDALSPNAIGVIASAFPLAVAIAIVRHNLFDIDRLLSHALVYGGLTAAVLGLYVAVVVGVGDLLRARDDPWLALLATALVAVGFQPLRSRLQRVVDRRLFGERDEPLRLLGRLGERLEAAIEPDRVLPTVVQTIAEALRLPYVAIVTDDGGAPRVSAEYGRPQALAAELPLTVDGERVGDLQVAARDEDATLSAVDRALLDTIAHHAATAVRAVRLTTDLQRSRAQLVALREEERRRLRRDLHDGLGPTLAALALKLEAASNVVRRAPERAETLIVEAVAQVHGSVAEVRRLVHGLRPPALDDLGLLEALRSYARQLDVGGLRVVVDGPDPLPALPAAVEVAAYRIAQEALTNVVRHARARHCRVSLAIGDAVALEVRDDGRGLDPQRRRAHGIGLRSMAERAAELGGSLTIDAPATGGTRVRARIPLGEAAP